MRGSESQVPEELRSMSITDPALDEAPLSAENLKSFWGLSCLR
jgi:hypothetical protein